MHGTFFARPLISFVLPLLAAVAAYLFGTTRAWSAKPRRKGGQWEILVGATACVPGEVDCEIDTSPIRGRTLPSFGGGVSLGWRAARWIQLGGVYRFGMFHPDYEVAGNRDFDVAYQHAAYLFVRPTLPIWRLDLGVDLGPGFSRQVFIDDFDNRDYSQGFSFLVGPSIDVYLTKRVFLGAKVDLLLNVHDELCVERSGSKVCADFEGDAVAPVDQVIYGLHIGGNFGT